MAEMSQRDDKRVTAMSSVICRSPVRAVDLPAAESLAEPADRLPPTTRGCVAAYRSYASPYCSLSHGSSPNGRLTHHILAMLDGVPSEIDTRVDSIGEYDRRHAPIAGDVTDRQLAAVAAELDCAESTVSTFLQRAEASVVGRLVGRRGHDPV
jgi:hypothetical protein